MVYRMVNKLSLQSSFPPKVLELLLKSVTIIAAFSSDPPTGPPIHALNVAFTSPTDRVKVTEKDPQGIDTDMLTFHLDPRYMWTFIPEIQLASKSCRGLTFYTLGSPGLCTSPHKGMNISLSS